MTDDFDAEAHMAFRRKHFHASTELRKDDLIDVEFITLRVTTNGFQTTGIEHTHDEWRDIVAQIQKRLDEFVEASDG